MKPSTKIAIAVFGGILAAIAITLIVIFFLSPSTVEITVRDAISGAAIPDATITLGNRMIQSSNATNHQFTNVPAGEYELVVKAPNYKEERVRVKVGAGVTRLPKPVELSATSVPAFDDFYIEEKEVKDGVGLLLRPIRESVADSSGKKTMEWIPFPGVDAILAFRISEQWKDGKILEQPVSSGSSRGKELFSGVVPETIEEIQGSKYALAGSVLMEKIKSTPAKFWVIDCLLLIPIPGKASRDEIQKILDGVSTIKDDAMLRAYLSKYSDKLVFSYSAVWNIQNPATKPVGPVTKPVAPAASPAALGTQGGNK